MMIALSPAKTLDFETKIPTKKFSINENSKESMELISGLRTLSSEKISKLMDLS